MIFGRSIGALFTSIEKKEKETAHRFRAILSSRPLAPPPLRFIRRDRCNATGIACNNRRARTRKQRREKTRSPFLMASFFTSLFGAPGGGGGPPSSSSSAGSKPHEVSSEAEFRSLTSRGVACVDFYADWCGPCKAVAPVFERFAASYPTVKFLKVNVDRLTSLAGACSVAAMPTFQVFKEGKCVGSVTGADMGAVEALLREHAPPASFEGSGRTLAGGGGGVPTAVAAASSASSSFDHKDFKEGEEGSISIVLRLVDGSRATARFPKGATVKDLEDIIAAGCGGTKPASMTAGFPPSKLSDLEAPLLPLNGSVVTCSNRP